VNATCAELVESLEPPFHRLIEMAAMSAEMLPGTRDSSKKGAMTASKSLPARPSVGSLRKQAKKLARDIAAGHADAMARARAQLPGVDLPVTV
jgi:hypothetical protein